MSNTAPVFDRELILKHILDLSTEHGINASGKEEVYGCVFGRDGAKSVLKLLRVYEKTKETHLLELSRRTLDTLISLQGTKFNIQSGEEPGKFIHEFRENNYQFIINMYGPRYIYADGSMKNYDSLDSTPLALIAIYKYWELTQDKEFLLKALPSVEQGLNWIITYGDRDKDLLLEYDFPKERTTSGSRVQSWTDSEESIKRADGTMPFYPIAPVEVQGYAWLAFKLWADFYNDQTTYTTERTTGTFGQKLEAQAKSLKAQFNKSFLVKDKNLIFAVQALDGYKRQIPTITANPLLLLWATYRKNDTVETILETKYVQEFVERGFQDDLFDKDAGIRTMSTFSPTFNPNQDSYHNGSFWPMLNGFIYEGLQNWGYAEKADRLRIASMKPITYFSTPIELYIKTADGYAEYKNSLGHVGCRNQAWSAVSVLDFLSS